jgi:SpoVK/Ycf46/Vps4 family AAA+-type ATPase
MNSLLGETERPFDQAFQTFEAMAPNVVFIDEFEKAFSQGGTENDGGTMQRTTGRLLSWLSDNHQPNFIIATSNNISRMGELGRTITRSGRFDKLFFVDVPTREARREILNTLLKDHVQDRDIVLHEISDETDKFTGADLRAVVNEATMNGQYRNEPLSVELLRAEVKKKTLKINAVYDSFSELRKFAELYCEPAGSQPDAG